MATTHDTTPPSSPTVNSPPPTSPSPTIDGSGGSGGQSEAATTPLRAHRTEGGDRSSKRFSSSRMGGQKLSRKNLQMEGVATFSGRYLGSVPTDTTQGVDAVAIAVARWGSRWPGRPEAQPTRLVRAPCAVLHSPYVGHTAAWRLTIMQPLSCLEARICVVVTTGLAIITVHITVLTPFHNIFSPFSCPIYSCSDLALTTGPIRTPCSCPRLLLLSLEPSHSVSPFPVGPSLTHVTPSPQTAASAERLHTCSPALASPPRRSESWLAMASSLW